MATLLETPTESEIHDQWDDFVPEELDWIDGKPTNLVHAIATKYGISEDEAAWQVKEFMDHRRDSVASSE